MKKVMIFGTFDTIEQRHHNLLQQAVDHGDGVMVVVSRDESVSDVQEELVHDEYERLAQIMSIDVVDDVILEHGNKIDIMHAHRPDIIMIGSHQMSIADEFHDHADDMETCGCVIVYV